MKTIVFLSALCFINALPNNIKSKDKDTKQMPVVVAVKQENAKNKNISTSPTTSKNLITTELPKVAEKQDNENKQAMIEVPVEFANAFIPMVKYFSNFFEPRHKEMEKTNQVSKDVCQGCANQSGCAASTNCFIQNCPDYSACITTGCLCQCAEAFLEGPPC